MRPAQREARQGDVHGVDHRERIEGATGEIQQPREDHHVKDQGGRHRGAGQRGAAGQRQRDGRVGHGRQGDEPGDVPQREVDLR